MTISGETGVTKFLGGLPAEQRRTLSAVRDVVLEHMPKGYVERLSGRIINYEVPLERYPDTYNGQPLMYAALAAQKSHYALYLMSPYQDERIARELRDGFKAAGRKLDMGKSCLRFRRLEDLPLDVVGKVIARTPVADFVARYEASRSGARSRAPRRRSSRAAR